MARSSTTAAAGLLACAAVLLLFAGQSAAIIFIFPFTRTFPNIFPVNYFPPIVTIYSKQNTGLNMAARDGKVVLVPANSSDLAQLWWKIPPVTTLFDGEGEKYWLVNFATQQAIASPTQKGHVQLAEFNPFDKTQLWVPTTALNGAFYQIKPVENDDMALNAFGAAYNGAVIGIWPAKPADPNTLWFTSKVILH